MFKTRICGLWKKGICKFKNCKFAHGEAELRSESDKNSSNQQKKPIEETEKVETTKVEPKKGEPKKVETKKVEPKKVETKKVETKSGAQNKLVEPIKKVETVKKAIEPPKKFVETPASKTTTTKEPVKPTDTIIEFSDEKRAAIVNEVIVDFIAPTELAKKYNITSTIIRGWIKKAGHKMPMGVQFKALKENIVKKVSKSQFKHLIFLKISFLISK